MAEPAKKQSSIFDVSAETRRKFSDAFGPGSLLSGAFSAAGTAASGLASGRPIALGGLEPIATGVQAAGRQALQLGTSIPKIGASFLQRLGTPRGMRGM